MPFVFFLENEPEIYDLKIEVKETEGFPYELIPNGKEYEFKRGIEKVVFYKYKDKIIWGFTAKIMYDFIKKFKENKQIH